MLTKVLAVVALTAAIAAPAQAETSLGFGVGLGFGLYGGGHYPGYYPIHRSHYDGISCSTAKSIVKDHGFRKVHATDCAGKIMGFKGKKKNNWYQIEVNRRGKIVDVDNL